MRQTERGLRVSQLTIVRRVENLDGDGFSAIAPPRCGRVHVGVGSTSTHRLTRNGLYGKRRQGCRVSSCFLREVDSSSVMVNASTRFADGYEYGLGAEIAISTDKLRVRGPVGLERLTSQKFIVLGDGHIRK